MVGRVGRSWEGLGRVGKGWEGVPPPPQRFSGRLFLCGRDCLASIVSKPFDRPDVHFVQPPCTFPRPPCSFQPPCSYRAPCFSWPAVIKLRGERGRGHPSWGSAIVPRNLVANVRTTAANLEQFLDPGGVDVGLRIIGGGRTLRRASCHFRSQRPHRARHHRASSLSLTFIVVIGRRHVVIVGCIRRYSSSSIRCRRH